MLSKTLFLRLTVSLFEDKSYEALQVLGDPMVLHDGSDGHPIAAIHLKHGQKGPGGGAACIITKQNEHLFQALYKKKDKDIPFVVLTNLEFFEHILIGIANDDIADHIILRPGESYKLFLVEDCRDFTVAVCPTKPKIAYKDAKWSCPNIICRSRPDQGSIAPFPPPVTELDEACVSQMAKLKLILPDECNYAIEAHEPRTRATMLKKGMDLIYETVINNNKRLLDSLKNKVYHLEDCCICLDGAPDVVFVKCGHGAVHDECLLRWEKPKECPICREEIIAKVHME